MDPDAREPIPLGYGRPFARRRRWMRVVSVAVIVVPMLALGVGLGRLVWAVRYRDREKARLEASEAALARRNAAAVEKMMARERATSPATRPAKGGD